MSEKPGFGSVENAFEAFEKEEEEVAPVSSQTKKKGSKKKGVQKDQGQNPEEQSAVVAVPEGAQTTEDVQEGFAELARHIEDKNFPEARKTANVLNRVLGRKIFDSKTGNKISGNDKANMKTSLAEIVDKEIPAEFKKPETSLEFEGDPSIPGETAEDRKKRYAKYKKGQRDPSFQHAYFGDGEMPFVGEVGNTDNVHVEPIKIVQEMEQPLRISPSSQPEFDGFLKAAGYGVKAKLERPLRTHPDNTLETNEWLEKAGFRNVEKEKRLEAQREEMRKKSEEEIARRKAAAEAEKERQRLEEEERKKAELEANKNRKEQEEQDEKERLAIFNLPYRHGAEGFADFNEAHDDEGYTKFLHTYEQQNGITGRHEQAIENDDERFLKESYEKYSMARFVAAELPPAYAEYIGGMAGTTIRMPSEGKPELDKFVARLLFEPGNEEHLEDLYLKVRDFKEGPDRIAQAEAGLEEELKRFNASDIESARDYLHDQIRAKDVHLAYADNLERMAGRAKRPSILGERVYDEVQIPETIKKHYDKIDGYFTFFGADTYTLDKISSDFNIDKAEAEQMVSELVQTGVLEEKTAKNGSGAEQQYHLIKHISHVETPGRTEVEFRPVAGIPRNGPEIKKEGGFFKGIGRYVNQYKEVGKLVKEGYMTEEQMKGMGGFFGKAFNSTKIIQAAAERIRIDHQAERDAAEQGLRNIDVLESRGLQIKNDYQILRKNLLVHLEPSKKIRDAFGKELAKQIRENLRNVAGSEDGVTAGTGDTSKLNAQQRVLENVQDNQRKQQAEDAALRRRGVGFGSNRYSGMNYFSNDSGEILDESTLEAIQTEINESFRTTMAKKVAVLLERKSADMNTPFSTFAKEIDAIFMNPSNGDPAYGSIKGPEAKRMILEILRDKQAELKDRQTKLAQSATGPRATISDSRILPLSRLINKISKNGQAA